VARWTCPECDREFGRTRQSHVCVPGGTLDDTFSGRPEIQRRIYDAVADHVRSLGPVHEDAVGVGVFLKSLRTFAQVRPRTRDVALFLWLPRQVEDRRIGRIAGSSGSSVIHQVALRSPEEVDDVVRGWLSEAYLAADDPGGW
jgi:hypothetical protein